MATPESDADAKARGDQWQDHSQCAGQSARRFGRSIFEMFAFWCVAKPSLLSLYPLQCTIVGLQSSARPQTVAQEDRPMTLQKAALVTGSTSGIGLASPAPSRSGRLINGFGIHRKSKFAGTGRRPVSVLYDNADLGDAAAIEAMIKRCTHELSAPDILVNNAGIQFVSPVEDFPTEKWEAILRINLTAVFHTSRLCLPAMRERGWGRIITRLVHAAVGSQSKSAMCRQAWSGRLHQDHRAGGGEGRVTVNCISPAMSGPLVETRSTR
jgi:3-hydroxybutyrate dehydrogenase